MNFLWMAVAFALSFALTPLAGALARRVGAIDAPGSPRKIHTRPIPLLGGTAVFVSVAACVGFLLSTTDLLTSGEIQLGPYLGFLAGGALLMIGGYLDDRFELAPRFAILFPVAAAAVAVGSGIEVEKLTNPFGGIIYLLPWQSDVLVFVWLLVVMYTTKFLDGLDGLATGVTMVGSLIVMLLATTAAYFQPDVALLSAVAVGALAGFFVWNFHPAKIFLGEGGSTFVGFLLGTLAVISGGKLATALLVLGIPLLDAVWVVTRRLLSGGMKAAAKGDRKHLHHRLLALGWGQRRIVVSYLLVASAFGTCTLFLQSREKLFALVMLALLMTVVAVGLVMHERSSSK